MKTLQDLRYATTVRGSQLVASLGTFENHEARRFAEEVMTEDFKSFASGVVATAEMIALLARNKGLSEDVIWGAIYPWACRCEMPDKKKHAICFLLGQGKSAYEIARMLDMDDSWVSLAVSYLKPDGLEPLKPQLPRTVVSDRAVAWGLASICIVWLVSKLFGH